MYYYSILETSVLFHFLSALGNGDLLGGRKVRCADDSIAHFENFRILMESHVTTATQYSANELEAPEEERRWR
jgi:hypothetical protein